jgi:hypothetical protein
MRAILSIVSLLLIASLVFSEEPYTVILKNGKMMKGHLLYENGEMIVFKDDKGLQYSLKKSVLDLEKMKEANQPPPPPPDPLPVPEPPAEIQQTQPTTDTTESAPIEATQEQEATPIVSTDQNPYSKSLHEATLKLEAVFETAKSLLDGMMTAWEVNASTGRDPAAALQEFKATKAATITALADSQLQTLDKLQESLGSPPSEYVSALDNLNRGILELHQYYAAIRQYEGKPSLRVLRSRLAPKEQSIQKKIEELKKL